MYICTERILKFPLPTPEAALFKNISSLDLIGENKPRENENASINKN